MPGRSGELYSDDGEDIERAPKGLHAHPCTAPASAPKGITLGHPGVSLSPWNGRRLHGTLAVTMLPEIVAEREIGLAEHEEGMP
jgi:hypothetical protein